MAARSSLAIAVGLATALMPAARAFANGRAPLTNGMHFQPGDNQSIFVATTFGFLISHDNGCTFRWICEQNIGYGGTYDPTYAIAADGTLFATTYTGLSVSRDGGCTWSTATATTLPGSNAPVRAKEPLDGSDAQLAGVWIAGLDVGPTGEVWIGTADSGFPNDVYRSTDDGVTFQARGMHSSTIWWKSVKVAPSDPMRVYVGGYQVAGTLADGGAMLPTAHLIYSSDDGDTWSESPLAAVTYGPTPLIQVMAVDPTNEDVVYVLSPGANPPAGDILYRSADGGQTLTQVLASVNPVRDVVVRDSSTVVVATTTGASESIDGGNTFSTVTNAPQLECLGQRGDNQLFGCGANWEPDYLAVGRSSDASSWQEVFRFVNLAGPLECPAGTMQHDVCDVQMWSGLQQQFGSTGPTCGSDAVPDGAADAGAPTTKTASGGCCDASEGAGAIAALWTLAIAAWLARRRR